MLFSARKPVSVVSGFGPRCSSRILCLMCKVFHLLSLFSVKLLHIPELHRVQHWMITSQEQGFLPWKSTNKQIYEHWVADWSSKCSCPHDCSCSCSSTSSLVKVQLFSYICCSVEGSAVALAFRRASRRDIVQEVSPWVKGFKEHRLSTQTDCRAICRVCIVPWQVSALICFVCSYLVCLVPWLPVTCCVWQWLLCGACEMWLAQHLCSQALCCTLLSSHRPQESWLLGLYSSPEFKSHWFSTPHFCLQEEHILYQVVLLLCYLYSSRW